MAQYNYDGGLASYFLLTFLALILIPTTLSLVSNLKSQPTIQGCQCDECVQNRENLNKAHRPTLLKPGLSTKTLVVSLGWVLFAIVIYFVLTNVSNITVYDPFTILGISPSATEKEIKKFYKKLSLKFHPDTVKLAEGQTPESAQEHFIELTKAYKALTDEVVRKNFLEYGHPDGKQTVEVGLAMPAWVVDAHNNIWVLGLYGVVFGAVLPYIVGKWWFGSRSRTKDGVQSNTATVLFKNLQEESTPTSMVATLSRAAASERPATLKPLQTLSADLGALQKEVARRLGTQAQTVLNAFKKDGEKNTFILFYAHLARIPILSPVLKEVQKELLLQTPLLLNSLLAMALGHGWLPISIEVMHLHAYFAQAILPGQSPLLQYPLVDADAVKNGTTLKDLIKDQEKARVLMAASRHVGKLEVVDAQFKVIGERLVTPGAFVQLVFKVRVASPLHENVSTKAEAVDKQAEAEADEKFLESKGEMEEIPGYKPQWAHAPHWPANRKAGWWCVVGDSKTQKVFVPPFKFADVPFASSSSSSTASPAHDYRSYKTQFQAPQQVGTYTLHVSFVSDTYLGEDQTVYLQLKVDDLAALDDNEQDWEDEISEPEEDTLAGQMAVMRGGSVKKSPYHKKGEDSEDESTTDGDESSDSDSSDSD